ncbi:MAG: Crp/Fnr family transcriptional regulator [Burkholderiales bacterium]
MPLTVNGKEIPDLQSLGEAAQFSGRIFELIEDGFGKITRDEARLLANAMQVYRVKAGTPFIAEDDPGDFMVLLLEGRVEVVKGWPEGKLLATVEPGKTLGEMSMIDGEPRFATCVAVVETTFAVLLGEALLRLIDEHPALGAKILLQLSALLNQRLRAASAKLVEALESRY